MQGHILLIIVILLMKPRYDRSIDKIQNQLRDKFQKRFRLRKGHSLPESKEKSPLRGNALSLQRDNHQDEGTQLLNMQQKRHNSSHLDSLDSTLHHINFSHHHEESCLCNSCSCGRHLCKMNVIKPDLKKATVYQTLFKLKKWQQLVVVKPEETTPLKANHLDLSSIYLKDYNTTSSQKVEKRPRPQDQLKFDGPAPSITTYGSLFPGHRGHNQYVKPTNKHVIGEFPLLAKSVYSTEYVVRKTSKSDYEKQHDSLRTGSNWFGSSTYNKSFLMPNPENYAKKAKNIEKRYKQADFSHQFETNYTNEFVEKPSAVCPSKIQLELSNSKVVQNSKHLFKENSDYKAMSPQFKAIATSKHFYV